jgi:hypothetical protein
VVGFGFKSGGLYRIRRRVMCKNEIDNGCRYCPSDQVQLARLKTYREDLIVAIATIEETIYQIEKEEEEDV